MPVEFVRQNACENGKCASTRLTLDYDGSGRRISKTVWRKDVDRGYWYTDNVTHYTGIGTEVRENFAGFTPGAKVVVSLPEGLGRYAPGDASENADAKPLKDENGNELAGMLPGTNFEWYLKNHQGESSENALVHFHCRAAGCCALRHNHLGSTMLVFGTQSTASPDVADNGTLKAAYDYHAFGEQLTLVEPTDKVTENFTGKERDDETQLNYFGARYLDPMLGLWTSVDAKRQYQNPYLYAGNNPIMRIDPDGNQDEILGQYFHDLEYNTVEAVK